MEVALLIFAVVAFASATLSFGFQLACHKDMRNAASEFRLERSKLEDLLKVVTAEHNKLVTQMADTNDRVAGIGLKVSGAFGPSLSRK